jgi:hypothetical protein
LTGGGREIFPDHLAQLRQAARDPAGDRAGGDVEGGTDRVVALVPAEEAVEKLAAGIPDGVESRPHGHRLVEVAEHVGAFDIVGLVLGERVAGELPQPVDAETPRQLREPGEDRVVAAELPELLVRTGEDILEDILRVLGAKPESPRADGEDIAGEPLDELVPRGGLTRTAAGNELRVGLGGRLDRRKIRLREAAVQSLL